MPKVTVIMATYNDDATIAESIGSILQQDFDDWELIVVNDASTDATVNVLEQFSDEERIRVISLDKNSGSGVARNIAIREAAGEYLAILDADDIALPQRLRLQAAALDADPALAAVAAQVAEFGTWGGPVPGRWPTSDQEVASRQLSRKMPIPHPSAMFRTSEVRRVGGYDERCRRAQDFALLLKLSDRRVRCLDEVLVHYRTQRPVTLSYVIRNGRYAQLARDRFEMSQRGLSEDALPLEPTKSIRTDLASVKSWVVRNLQEQIGSRK